MFRSTDDAAIWLLCLTGETRSNILSLMKLYVRLNMSLQSGVTFKAEFATDASAVAPPLNRDCCHSPANLSILNL